MPPNDALFQRLDKIEQDMEEAKVERAQAKVERAEMRLAFDQLRAEVANDLPEIRKNITTICEIVVAANSVKGAWRVVGWLITLGKVVGVIGAAIGTVYAAGRVGWIPRILGLMSGIVVLLLVSALLGCKGPPVSKAPAVASPAPALRGASTAATGAAKTIDDESASITGAVGWLAQVVAGLPVDLQATTQAKIDGLAATAAHLSAIAATLRVEVAAPVAAGAKQADAQVKENETLAGQLKTANTRADKAEQREKDAWRNMLRIASVMGAVGGMVSIGLAVWQLISGNLKGAGNLAGLGVGLLGCAAGLELYMQYWMWIGGGMLALAGGLGGYLIWCRIKLHQKDVTLGTIVPAVQEAGAAGEAVRKIIAQKAGAAKVSRIVEKVVTDIKHAVG